MKKSIKIAILIAVLFLAVGGVLFYMKTRVEPPKKISTANQYSPAIDSISKAVLTTARLDEATPVREDALDMISRLYSEEFISADTADRHIADYENHYAGLIVGHANGIFNQSVWKSEELNGLRSMVNSQLDVKLTDKATAAINDASRKDLQNVLTTINNYNSAWATAKNTGFGGINDARQKIAKANEYRNMSPLSNCTALVNALKEVPRKIAASHKATVNKKLNALRNIDGINSVDDYTRLRINPFKTALNEYKNASFYGSANDGASAMEREASAIIDEMCDRIYDRNNDPIYY